MCAKVIGRLTFIKDHSDAIRSIPLVDMFCQSFRSARTTYFLVKALHHKRRPLSTSGDLDPWVQFQGEKIRPLPRGILTPASVYGRAASQ